MSSFLAPLISTPQRKVCYLKSLNDIDGDSSGDRSHFIHRQAEA